MHFNNITPKDEYQYFFGYYDVQPYDESMRYHLVHRVRFRDRHPSPNDIAEIGFISLADKTFHKISETNSWNFQQGAMLMWFESGKSVIFNDFDGQNNISRVVSLSGIELKRFSLPIAAVDKKREHALSINFSRIHDFRKGYGYSNLRDKNFLVDAPDDDGVFLLNLKTGESALISSYAKMKKEFNESPFTEQKLVVNHVTFSPSGKKYAMLLRNFPQSGSKWGTVLAIGDLNGNFKKLTGFRVNSHYSFNGDETLAIWSALPEYGVYFFNIESGERIKLNNQIVDHGDIHVNFSPDGKFFIGDGYIENGKRYVYKYDLKSHCGEKLFGVYSEPVDDTDIRCDLHARFSPDGKRISYDSTENFRREIIEYFF